MYRILWNGQSAMNANQVRLDAISNNIANMNTTGYKRVDVNFKDSYKESLERKGYPSEGKDAYTGTGVLAGDLQKEHYQGALLRTDITTDFALDGVGMFKIIDSNGNEFYTRDGSFMTDVNGDIVDSAGNKLEIEYTQEYLNLKNRGELSLKGGQFLVDKEGNIEIKHKDKFVKVGKIPLYETTGSDSYISVGQNRFLPAEGATMTRSNNTAIYQGALEGSNVDIGQEFSEMILTQRAFQLGSKSITTADEMWGMVNNLRSK